MNKVLKWVFVALVVVGAGVSYFSTIPLVDAIGIAVACGSAGALISAQVYDKEKQKTWKDYVALGCICVGAFGLGFAGYSTDAISKVVSSVVGVIGVILGIFSMVMVEKNKA